MVGRNPSSRTYRVTPESTKSDVSLEFITISGDVLRRIERLERESHREKKTSPEKPQIVYNRPRHPAPPRDTFKEHWMALSESIRRNEEILRRTSRELEEKLQKKVEQDRMHPVKRTSDELVECLRMYPRETLRCSEEIAAFNRQIFREATKPFQGSI